MNQARVRRIGWGVVAAVVLTLLLFCNQLVGLLVDWLWFGEVGQRPVWWTILGARVQLALLFGAAFFLLTFLNVWVARRGTPQLTPRYEDFPLRVQVGRLA